MNINRKGSKKYTEYDLLLKYEAASKIENILLWLRWPLSILILFLMFYQVPVKYAIIILVFYIIIALLAGHNTLTKLVALDKFREKQYWNSIKKENK